MRQKTFDKESWYSPSPLIHEFFRHQKLCETKKGSSTKFFGTVREQIFYRKSWSSPHRHKRFRYQKFSESQHRRVPLWNFSALRQKKFNKKSWHNSLKHKIFRYPKLVTHWRVPLRNFSALWDKKLLTKNRDTPPSPLIHKLFRYQKLCETKKGSSTKFFGTVREQIFYRKSWSSPHRHKRFRYQKFSESQHRRVPLWNFSALRQKKFNKKSWHNSLKHKIFRYPKLVTHWRVPLRNFSTLWDKKLLTKNRDTPPSPLIHKFFRYQKFCETQKGSPTKIFGTVRQQIFNRKSWYSPHRHKVFRYPKLMKHWWLPLQKLSALWGKKFSTEDLDTLTPHPTPLPHPLIHKLFRYQKFSETQHRRVPLWNFSALWDKKFSTENLHTPSPLLSINFFATGHFLNHRSEGFLYEIFRHCETKNFWQRIVILPLPSYTYIFSTPETLWNKEGFIYEVFRYCERTNFL